MANVTQLKHLEHLEDEMLNYGVEGCKAAVNFLKELRRMLGCDNSIGCLLYTSPSPRDRTRSRMPSSA